MKICNSLRNVKPMYKQNLPSKLNKWQASRYFKYPVHQITARGHCTTETL